MVHSFEVRVEGGNIPFNRGFKEQINAELYVMLMEGTDDYTPVANFAQKFTKEELIAEKIRLDKLGEEATRLQNQARDRTRRNFDNPNWNPCEVCGKKHRNYECCEACNYDTHTCHFCGTHLGHREVSTCYILEGLGE